MEPEEVETVEDLAKYIGMYADEIYVREKIDGKIETKKLSELSPKSICTHVGRFLARGVLPIRFTGDKKDDTTDKS